MKVIRDKEQGRLSFVDEESPIMELTWFFDEFIWIINTNQKIVVTKEVDEVFYNNLNEFMNNHYKFYIDNKLSYKENNKLQWLSDQCVDIEDEDETNRINRLIIERVVDSFVIHVENPYLERMGVSKRSYTIAFSPGGNGYMVINQSTHSNLQDDVVNLYSKSINIGEDIGPCLRKNIK